LRCLEQAFVIMREVGDRAGEGRALNQLGRVYRALGQYDKALRCLEQALTLARKVGNRDSDGPDLSNLGTVYRALGQYTKSLRCLEQALVIMREVGDRVGEGTTFGYLMAVWKAQRQPRLAIFYGKQAVNVLQEIRRSLQPLPQELQEGFLTVQAPVYRKLAEALIAEGRLLEAQQVLDLLKAEEYLDFVRRDALGPALFGQATLTPDEALWDQRYRAIADHLAGLGTEY